MIRPRGRGPSLGQGDLDASMAACSVPLHGGRPPKSAVAILVLFERGFSGLEGEVGRVQARALRVLQQVSERPCYTATRTGTQTAINGHRVAGPFRATARNPGGTIRQRPWTALNGPFRTGFESGEGHWGVGGRRVPRFFGPGLRDDPRGSRIAP